MFTFGTAGECLIKQPAVQDRGLVYCGIPECPYRRFEDTDGRKQFAGTYARDCLRWAKLLDEG